ncbi:MAG: sensor histidine kinase [Bacteroidales bacterium]
MKRVLNHILFWVVILIFQVTRSRTGSLVYTFDDILPVFLEHLTMLPLLIVASYFTADYILPKYFYTRRYFKFGVALVFSGIFFVFAMRAYLFYVFFPEHYPDFNGHFPKFMQFNIFQHIFYIYSTVAIVVMVKYIRRVNRIEAQKNMLEKQTIASELALLRSQVNPHFLFNTLNNINALIVRDSKRAYASILKLSEIMRYMLYDAKNETVFLKKEIEYINSYIGLLQLRVESPGFIKFDVQGYPEDISIAPMLFVPLVENAFKHGNKDATPPGVSISMKIEDRSIFFEVANYVKQNPEVVDSTGGIGIPNLKRRLELLYPNNHTFNVEIVDDKYIATLQVNLK